MVILTFCIIAKMTSKFKYQPFQTQEGYHLDHQQLHLKEDYLQLPLLLDHNQFKCLLIRNSLVFYFSF